MVDLGLFNFVKNALAEGKSKDEIKIALAKGGWKETDMEEAYTAVKNDASPTVVSRKNGSERTTLVSTAAAVEEHRPTIIIALCGYFFVTFILTVLHLAILSLSGELPLSIEMESLPSIVIVITGFVSMVGYWNMKRWGVMLYTLNTVGLMLYLSLQLQGITIFPLISTLLQSLLIPLATIYIGFASFEEMV